MVLDLELSAVSSMLPKTSMLSRKSALSQAVSSHARISPEPHVLFTEQEDDLLKELVKRHGTKKWHIIAVKMQNKTPRDCRKRWQTYLNTCMNKCTWSAEEDRLLLEGQNTFGNRWTEIAKLVPGRKETSCSVVELTHKEPLMNIPESREFVCLGTSKRPKMNNMATTGTLFMQEVKDVGNCMSPRDRRAELEEVMGWLTARTPTPECEERDKSTPLVGSFMQKNLARPQVRHEILPSNMGIEIKQHEIANTSVLGEVQAKVHPDVEDLVFLLVGDGTKSFWNGKREQIFDMPCHIPGCNSSLSTNADAITKTNGGDFCSREPSSFMTS